MSTRLPHAIAVAGLAVSFAACVPPDAAADFSICCTCLDQRSPLGGDAVDDAADCLGDAGDGTPDVDQCESAAAATIATPTTPTAIIVVDEQCHETACADECRGAILRGATFDVVEQRF